MQEQDKILEIFKKTGALLSGHFVLSSGFHSDNYFQCALVLQYPEHLRFISELLGKRFSKDKIDVIIAPALGGIVIAAGLGEYLYNAGQKKLRIIFTERVDDKMNLRRGFSLKSGERVLVIEDVVTTGGSVKEIIRLAENEGAEIVGVSAIVDRSGGEVEFGFRKEVLYTLDVKKFSPSDCPLCKQGIKIEKPGSRKSFK